MKRLITLLIVIFLISVLFITFYSFAQEAITVTTYYPAPYGVYKEIRADALAIGSSYREEPLTNGTLIVSGEVGIGTSNPSAVLETHPSNSFSTGLGGTPIAKFKRGNGGDNYLAVHADAYGVYLVSDTDDTTPNAKDLYIIAQPCAPGGGCAGRNIYFQTADTAGNSPETKLTIKDSGRIGIGDDQPSAVLEAHPPDSVQTGLGDTPIAKFKRGWGGDNYLAVHADVDGVYLVSDSDDTTPNQKDLYLVAKPGTVGKSIYLQTADTASSDPETRLSIRQDGRVGIGTASPSDTLTIKAEHDSNSFGLYNYSDYYGGVYRQLALIGRVGNGSNEAAGRLVLYDQGTARTQITSRGNSYFNASGYGNVGIGTTSPTSKLTVNGEIKATGNLVSGGDILVDIKPVLIKRFSNVGNDANFDTGISKNDYYCVAAGWAARWDTNEESAGNNRIWTYTDNSSYWKARAQWHSHHDHESCDIDIICFRKGICQWTGASTSTNSAD